MEDVPVKVKQKPRLDELIAACRLAGMTEVNWFYASRPSSRGRVVVWCRSDRRTLLSEILSGYELVPHDTDDGQLLGMFFLFCSDFDEASLP